MDISIIVDLMHTFSLVVLTYFVVSHKTRQNKVIERVELIAKNPLKARKIRNKL